MAVRPDCSCPPGALWFPCLAIKSVFRAKPRMATFTGGLAGTCLEELKASKEEEAAASKQLGELSGAFPHSPISAREASAQF